jgi:hypothetical protein
MQDGPDWPDSGRKSAAVHGPTTRGDNLFALRANLALCIESAFATVLASVVWGKEGTTMSISTLGIFRAHLTSLLIGAVQFSIRRHAHR